MPDPKCRMLIADDHSVIRTGLRYLLEQNVKNLPIAEADSCQGLLRALKDSFFTHLILDLQLGDCNSLEIIPGILRSNPGLRVLVYTMSSEEVFAQRLLNMGVHGFLSKEADEETVSKALDHFLLRGSYLGDSLRQELLLREKQPPASANPFDELSDREMTVLLYLLQGLRVKEISARLDLKMSTIATYKVRIFEKLGVNNLADMQRLADLYHVG
jgi:DNA-binding NarL/FixJ family response regulator